jgi:phosphoglycerol transferase
MNKVVRFVLCYVAGMMLFMPFWIFGTFGGGITIEQMIFHLMSGAEGVAGADITLKRSFILTNLVAPLLFPLLLIAVTILITKISDEGKRLIIDKWSGRLCLLFFMASASVFACKINLYQYIRSRFGKDTFSGLYADPARLQFRKPSQKKNLLLVYVESLECDMAHLGPTGINAIKPLEDLPGYQVKNFVQAPGTGWSIAGMVSSQAGVPLKPFYFDEAGNYALKSYFPNLTSLGDILARDGYVQYFLVGPDIRFSGMNKFYYGHGCNYAIGLDEWLSRGLDRSLFTGWGDGLHDDTLLDEAYRIIASNRSAKRPFAITIMTTDTHFPDGYPSAKCDSLEAHESFIGAFKYTSRYLAGFINRLISEGLLENTEIIIMGDHLFMASDDQLKQYFSKNRRVFFKMITADHRKPKREVMTHFDVAPTILDLLGKLKDPDAYYGLGVSLFSSIPPAEYDRHLRKVMSDEILSPSIVYDSFWSTRHTRLAR